MNVVVISAADLERELESLLDDENAAVAGTVRVRPRALAAVGANGVPLRALAVASTGVCAAILLALYAPAKAFLALYGTAVAGMLFIWVVILITFLRFRQALPADQLSRLPIRMPAHRLAPGSVSRRSSASR
jgi:L-asparagine transporter-like permease